MVTYPQYQYYQNYPAYQQQYQQPMQMQQPLVVQQNQSQSQNQILAWVQSEKEALDFPLQAGQSIFLMNQTEDYLYAKSCDQLGKTTFIKKKLIDETDNTNKQDLSDYIKRDELENMIVDRIQREFERRMSEISFKPTKARKQVIIDEE